MGRYLKNTPRLSVKFFNGDTNEQLFEIKNRSWMDVGELFADHHVTELLRQTYPDHQLPSNVIVLVSGEYELQL
jgi:hypothetical protein